MKAIVAANSCVGCGLCAESCPAVFEMDNDNLAVVKVDLVPPDAEGSCQEAAENCPVEAITITQ